MELNAAKHAGGLSSAKTTAKITSAQFALFWFSRQIQEEIAKANWYAATYS